ncbi:MAG: glycosyltransferase [Nanoarchaeota archaeon]|nr:glycosyltransferase [Nanoarchaeota archaeon]
MVLEFSIIIPARNEEDYIKNTLEALHKQSLKRDSYEIIVCDDASTDNTVKVAKPYIDKILKLEKCKTIAEVRNKGAEAAKSERLLFIDADTIVSQDLLKKIIDSKLQIGIPRETMFGDSKLWRFLNKINLWLLKNLPALAIYPGSCMLVNKKSFQEIKGFDNTLKFNEDNNLFKRLINKGSPPGIIDTVVETSDRRIENKGIISFLISNGLNYIQRRF